MAEKLEAPLKLDKIQIYADGGSRGNPGPAGAGAVLLNGEETIASLSHYLGHATNNVAEYTGLLIGLEKAKALAVDSVEVLMDSELVVKQMTGQYRVKNAGLIPLHQKARSLASTFKDFTITHVRREHNKKADALANKAMDEGMALRSS
jgi:ribonuclease HI